ncbi:hypothetical protein MP638_001931 [Amoeboaphelidium occidentale]|nr:hypothetical protein MP638_001931 [Amoeboaphelidium occidentale]
MLLFPPHLSLAMFSAFGSKSMKAADVSVPDSSSTSLNKLKKKRKKVKISISSDVYYEVNFNRAFWSNEFKQSLKKLEVKYEYVFEQQSLIVRGKTYETTEEALELIMKRLKETKDILDDVSISLNGLSFGLPQDAYAEEHDASTDGETKSPTVSPKNSPPMKAVSNSLVATPKKTLSPTKHMILPTSAVVAAALPPQPVSDDDDEKPLIVAEGSTPVKAVMPKREKTLMAAVDKHTAKNKSVFFSNGKVVQSNPLLYAQMQQQQQQQVQQQQVMHQPATVAAGPQAPVVTPQKPFENVTGDKSSTTQPVVVMKDRYRNSVVADMQKQAEERLKKNQEEYERKRQEEAAAAESEEVVANPKNRKSKPAKSSLLRFVSSPNSD